MPATVFTTKAITTKAITTRVATTKAATTKAILIRTATATRCLSTIVAPHVYLVL